MAFGVKVKDDVRPAQFISYPKEGDNTYRFLEEPQEWTKYHEHFDQEKMLSYPCSDERTWDEKKQFMPSICPGCEFKRQADLEAQAEGKEESGIWWPQKKYLVNVLTTDGYVNLVKLPVGVFDEMQLFFDRYKTVRDREYIVTRFRNREGRWKYSVDRGEKDNLDLSQYVSRITDHQAALQKSWIEAWGAEPGPINPLAPEYIPPKDEPLQDADNETKPTRRSMGDPVAVGEDPPSEPAGAAEPEQANEADDTIRISESELRKMKVVDLVSLIEKCGLEVPRDDMDTNELADFLMEKLS